uniref:Uncharacterized protein n=1 Tax=Meloidogyne enterolobii TaxID=390850 RepID=A0A6V7UEZ7_MELEN|nr:unnamed protein product [Meloidogyne enterolobii]
MMPLQLENLTIQSKFTQRLRASARLDDTDLIKMKQRGKWVVFGSALLELPLLTTRYICKCW